MRRSRTEPADFWEKDPPEMPEHTWEHEASEVSLNVEDKDVDDPRYRKGRPKREERQTSAAFGVSLEELCLS